MLGTVPYSISEHLDRVVIGGGNRGNEEAAVDRAALGIDLGELESRTEELKKQRRAGARKKRT